MTAVIPISPTSPLALTLASFVAFLLDEKLMHGSGMHSRKIFSMISRTVV